MVGLAISTGRDNVVPAFPYCRTIPLAPRGPQPPQGPTPTAAVRKTSGTHDLPVQAALGPRGFLLENQDVGTDVQRRMGEPVRRLRALLPGKARGRGYRRDLLHPRFLPAAGW